MAFMLPAFFSRIGAFIVGNWAKIKAAAYIATFVVGVKGYRQAQDMLAQSQAILANKTSAGGKIPVIYGTRRVGCQVVYMDVSNNDSRHLFVVYALSVGEVDEILGKTIQLDGNPLTDSARFKYGCYVGSDKISSGSGSLNTVSQVGSTISAGAGGFGTSPTSRYRITLNLHHGAATQTADPMLVASMPNWTSAHKLNGVAYISAHFKFDKEGMFAGVPQLTVQVRGKKVYDPRDSGQTFGSPSTYEFSSNPALCFLDYITNNEYGKGLTSSQINMSTFSSAANVCDTQVDNPYFGGTAKSLTWSGTSGDNFITIEGTTPNDDWWQNKIGELITLYDNNGDGVLTGREIADVQRDEFFDQNPLYRVYFNATLSSNYSTQTGSSLLKVKRFTTNGYLDTNKNVMENAKELLANMRGIFLYINGQYELSIEDTGTSSFSITDNHIISDAGISVDYGNKDKKANKVIVEFFNANKGYELDTATVLHDATPEYYSDDNDEILEIKAEFPYITDPYIAYNMGKAILTRSRNQTTMQFLGTPEMYKLNVGDIVDLTYAGLGFSGKVCRVEALELQPNGLVAVSLIEYFDVYTWEVPPQEPVEELANLPSAYAVKAPTGLTFTDSDSSSTDRPILSWTAPTDYPDYEFRVNVVDSSGNQLINRIVNTTEAELNFTPTGSNYVASVTSLNTLGTESDASTLTFSVSTAPVGLGDIQADAVTANTIDVNQLSAISADMGSITAGSIDIGSGNFTVSSAGFMTATGADISGDLTATTLDVVEANIQNLTLTLGGGILQDGSGNNLTVTNVINPNFPVDGLLHYFPLNGFSDPADTTPADVIDVVSDVTGVITGSNGSFDEDSPNGQSYVNGSATGITLLSNAQANTWQSTTGDFTVALWFKSTTESGEELARIIGRDASDFWSLVIDQDETGNQTVGLYVNSGLVTYDGASVNEWHHIAMVVNGTTSAKLYLDGVLRATDTTISFDASSRPVVLGCNTESSINTANQVFIGKLSDVRFYTKAITDKQVQSLYMNPAGGLPAKIEGDLFVTNSITADKLKVNTLSSLSANLGSITAGSIDIGSGAFSVTSAGVLDATGATIGGSFSAGSGNDIFKADSNGIYLGNGTFANAPFKVLSSGEVQTTKSFTAGVAGTDAIAKMSGTGDYRFWSGNETPSNASFSVDKDGKVIAKNLVLKLTDGTVYFDSETGFSSSALSQISTSTGTRVSTVSSTFDADTEYEEITVTSTTSVNVSVSIDTNFGGTYGNATENTAIDEAEQKIPEDFTLTIEHSSDGGSTYSTVVTDTFTRVNDRQNPKTTPASDEYKINTTVQELFISGGGGVIYLATTTTSLNLGSVDSDGRTTLSYTGLSLSGTTSGTTHRIRASVSTTDTNYDTTNNNVSSTTPRVLSVTDPSGSGFYVDNGSGSTVPPEGDITAVQITTASSSGLTGGANFTSGDATFTLALASSIDGAKTFTNNVVIQGDLDVQGTTTTIDTANLDVKDKNITLNYGTGDTSANANGAGITIQDAVSAGNDATLTWNTSNDSFNFSHPVNVTGTVTATDRGTFEDLVLTGDADDDLTFSVSAGDWYIRNSQQNNGLVIYDGTAGVQFLYNNQSRLEVLTAGLNVVNGTLSIAGTEFADASRNITAGTISSGRLTVDTTAGESAFVSTSYPAGFVRFGQNVGGGNPTDNAGLHIGWNRSNGGREVNMIFNSGATNADGEMIFTAHDGTTYADIFQINGGGNVDIKSGGLRIGTTTVIDSSSNLTNIGTISSGAITSTISGTSGNLITFNNTNGEIGSIETQGDEMVLMSVDRGLRIRTSAVNSIIPVGTARTSLDATIDLGSSAARFKNLYLSGSITSGAITSSGASTFSSNVNIDGELRLDSRYDSANGDNVLAFKDSAGNYSIRQNVNDGNGNYSISLGYSGTGSGQYAVTNDGVAKLLFGGHGRDGAVSLNAAPTGTAGNNISFSIGLLVDGSDNTIRVGASANGTGMDISAGTKVFDASGNAFATSYSVGSTTVIDSSSNLTNIGTIDSGVITADGLTVEGDVAIASDLPTITLTDNNNSSSRADIEYNFGYLTLDADANAVDAAEGIHLKIGGTTHFALATGGDISFYEDTGTTAKLFWDASAEMLGIGTTSPSRPLHISGTTVVQLELEQTSASNEVRMLLDAGGTSAQVQFAGASHATLPNTLTLSSAADTRFVQAGQTVMHIDSGNGGRVGIREQSPDALLHLSGGTTEKIILEDSASPRQNYIGFSSSDNLEIAADEDNLGTDSSIRFRIDADEKARITANGILGIGITPSTYLTNGYVLRLQGTTQTYISFNNSTHTTQVVGGFAIGHDASAARIIQRENQPMIFSTNDIDALTLGSDQIATFASEIYVSGGGTSIAFTGTGTDTNARRFLYESSGHHYVTNRHTDGDLVLMSNNGVAAGETTRMTLQSGSGTQDIDITNANLDLNSNNINSVGALTTNDITKIVASPLVMGTGSSYQNYVVDGTSQAYQYLDTRDYMVSKGHHAGATYVIGGFSGSNHIVVPYVDGTDIFVDGVVSVPNASANTAYTISASELSPFSEITADKPIAVSKADPSAPVMNTNYAGRVLGLFVSRYQPIDIYVYSPFTKVTVEFYRKSTAPVDASSSSSGDFIYSTTIDAGSGFIFQEDVHSTTSSGDQYFIVKADGLICAESAPNGGDYTLLSPAGMELVGSATYSPQSFGYTESSVTSSVTTVNNGSATYYRDNTGKNGIFAYGTADGAGGDAEFAVPIEYLSDYYIYPEGDITNFRLASYKTNTIKVLDSSGTVLYTYDHRAATKSAPIFSEEGAASGSGGALSSNGPFRFIGTAPFHLVCQNSEDDEMVQLGAMQRELFTSNNRGFKSSFGSPAGTTSPFNATANTLTLPAAIYHQHGIVTGADLAVIDLETGVLEISSQGEIVIAADAITADKIASNTITGEQINANLLNVQHFDNVSADIKSHLTTETFVPLSREGQAYVQRTGTYTGSNGSFVPVTITQVRNNATYVAIFSGVLGDVSGGRVQYSLNNSTWVNANGNTNISWSAGTYRGYTYVYTGQITTLSNTQSDVYWRVYFSGSYNHTQLSLNVMMDNTQ